MIEDGKRILQVSVTELQEYLDCKRSWDIQSANRQSLVKRGAPHVALWMGSAVHEGLAAHIAGEDIRTSVEEYLSKQRKEIADDYRRKVGSRMSPEEWQAFDESAQLVRNMLVGYFRYYGTTHTYHPYRAIASELTFRIPFPAVAQETSFYDEVWVVGTVDGVLLDGQGNLGIIDHKTFTQRPQLRDLQLDHQFLGYLALFGVLVNRPVKFFLYNGLNKKTPTSPMTLKSGRLSKDKSIITSAAWYERCIRENGEDPKDPYYMEHLAWLQLRDRQDNPFFVRHVITPSQHALVSWLDNTEKVLREMAQGPELPITYNRKWTGCWGCNVQDLCDAMTRGDDVEYMLRHNYTKGTYGTQRRLSSIASPFEIASVDDLIEYTRRLRDNSDSEG